jgi:crossover junction endodeoxyribonuclease RuvC
LLILGIDPGSVKTGWGLIEIQGRKMNYVASGVLSFNGSDEFLYRLKEIKHKIETLFDDLSPHEVAMESLIFVKSPTALIKLAQTRGVILSAAMKDHADKIFEYSPNLIKSSTTGHGHASKESIQKFLKMTLGVSSFKTHDESDALAVAICHAVNRGKTPTKTTRTKSRGLAASVKHKI